MNTSTADPCQASIAEISARLARREISPVEITRAILDRIAALDPKLHAYATVTAELAMAQARQAEGEIMRGELRGPLHGVPVAVKDLCNTRGIPTAAGMPLHRDFRPDHDATVVTRLRESGAVLVGKLQLTEGAMADHHPAVAVPVNPWSSTHWSGASSSGSGVATAASLCFAALGSDTGGSIRFPSAMNGVTGIKPTWGRVSRYGVFPLAPSLDHVGPMARSAEDAAIVLGAIAGPDANDPTTLRARVPDYLALAPDVRGLRIGLDLQTISTDVEPSVARALQGAVRALEGIGARIIELTLPPTAPLALGWGAYCAAEAAVVHEPTFPSRAAEYGPNLRGFLEFSGMVTGMQLARLELERRVFAGRLAALFDEIDLLLVPVFGATGMTAARVSALGADPEAMAAFITFTAPFDFSGSPTITMPCGFDDDGVPIGFQLVAPHLGEDRLVAAGRAFQEVTDWHRRRPVV
jgi:amidase